MTEARTPQAEVEPVVRRLAELLRDELDAVVDRDPDAPFSAEELQPVARTLFEKILGVAPGGDDQVQIIPGVQRSTGEPIITFAWGLETGQLTVQQAREHGLAMIDAAEVAEVESLMFRWLLSGQDATPEGAATILQQFRTFRATEDAARTVEEPDES